MPKKTRILGGSKYKMNDAHLHVVDFMQNSRDFTDILREMNKANIQKAAIFGLPVKKTYSEFEYNKPAYYLDNNAKCYYFSETDDIIVNKYRKLTQQQKKRLVPLLCGFNPTDRSSVDIIRAKLKRYRGVFKGVGEVMLRHDDLTNMTLGQTPRGNTEAMMDVAQLCREENIPLLIHHNLTSVWLDTHPEYLRELHDLLQRNPNTTVVWAHCGASRRVNIPNYDTIIRNMLTYYHNLYVDYSWIFYDEILCSNGEPREAWIKLTEDFSDRIMLGSDLFLNYELLGHVMKRYDNFLDRLTPKTREKVCTGNFNKIFG
ncbi:amidohydrolase [Candidatus Parcubacteria bacterium]|nr:MAG: amidohydrolase [Candidatus Parcubacteria bacterium]